MQREYAEHLYLPLAIQSATLYNAAMPIDWQVLGAPHKHQGCSLGVGLSCLLHW